MMSLIGKWANRKTVCVLTNMEEPLGYAVGNSLEVIEAVKALKGDMPEDVKEVIVKIATEMLNLADEKSTSSENKKKVLEVINNGKAYEKFKELVEKQGGDVSYIENTEKFERAPIIAPVCMELQMMLFNLKN